MNGSREATAMKGNARFLAVLAAAVLCGLNCAGQTNLLFYGANSNSLGVAFVDTNLSASAKASIVADLQLCLQEWGKKSELDLGTYEPGVVGYLYNFKRNPHYPEDLGFPKKLITNSVPGLALQIPKKLSDAYTNAFAFAAANSNIVAAAYEFVSFVSSTNFNTVTSNQISDYILYNQAPPRLYQLAFHDITNSLRHQTYYAPSILGFEYRAEGPSPTNLWLRVPNFTNPYGNVIEWSSYPPAIWHDGKWRFCIWEDNPLYELPQ